MLNLGIPIEFGPVAGGGGGSKWYAPLKGKPTVLPTATGTNSLSAGGSSTASANYCVAFGYGATASAVSGNYSIAVGYGPTASGPVSIALGFQPVAGNLYANAIGYQAYAVSDFSLAVGYQAFTTTGLGDVAIGYQCSARGGYSFSGGYQSAANAECVAIGYGANALYGAYGIAIGTATINGLYQIAFGKGASVTGDYSIAFGRNATSTKVNSQVFGYAASSLNDNEQVSSHVTKGRTQSPIVSMTTVDGATAKFAYIAIPESSASAFTGQCSAYRTATTGGGLVADSATWNIDGCIRRDGAGNYALVGIPVVGIAGAPDYSDAGAAGWVLAVAAVVGHGLRFTATGQAGETIDWTVNIKMTTTA